MSVFSLISSNLLMFDYLFFLLFFVSVFVFCKTLIYAGSSFASLERPSEQSERLSQAEDFK